MKKNTKPEPTFINVRLLNEKAGKVEIKTPNGGKAWVDKKVLS